MPPWIFLVENWSEWRHILKNTAGSGNYNNNVQQFARRTTKTVAPQICVILHAYCYFNFNPCGISENMMSFTRILNQELEQGKLIIMAAVDMFMEKAPKTCVLYLTDWNLERYLKRPIVYENVKKKWISRIWSQGHLKVPLLLFGVCFFYGSTFKHSRHYFLFTLTYIRNENCMSSTSSNVSNSKTCNVFLWTSQLLWLSRNDATI